MRSFPTVRDLASATDEEVNSHWAGLGFYRRARLLHAGAKRVVSEYGGIVPETVDGLLKLEGIGRYTACAVASIAFGVEVPVVDGNVCRVLSRLTGIANHIKAGVLKDDLGWILAERIVRARRPGGGEGEEDAGGGRCNESAGSPGEVNQALMELGATYCSPNGSGIDDGDPLREFYVSTRLGVAVGRSMRDCGGAVASVGGRIEGLVASEFAISSGEGGGSHCRLCDPGGVSTAYFDIVDKITAVGAAGADAKAKARREDAYAIAGHSSLPIPPPKKSKREEVIAVAVISSRVPDDDDVRYWLMVKRPLEGLLAGKWCDFFLETAHNICIENRAKLSESLRFIPRFQVSGNFHRCASGTRPSRRGGREMKNPESFRLSWFR
jgi:A/G-specific adenine glycosylase